MDTSYDVLVIILSITLAILLLLSIVFVGYLVRIIRKLNRIVDKAESMVENAEAVGEFFRRSAASEALMRLVANIVDGVRERRHRKGGKDE